MTSLRTAGTSHSGYRILDGSAGAIQNKTEMDAGDALGELETYPETI